LKRIQFQTPFLPDVVTDEVVAYSGHDRYETFQVELNFWTLLEFCTVKSMCLIRHKLILCALLMIS